MVGLSEPRLSGSYWESLSITPILCWKKYHFSTFQDVCNLLGANIISIKNHQSTHWLFSSRTFILFYLICCLFDVKLIKLRISWQQNSSVSMWLLTYWLFRSGTFISCSSSQSTCSVTIVFCTTEKSGRNKGMCLIVL